MTENGHRAAFRAFYAAVALAAAAALVAAAHLFGIVLCPLKRFTGVPCPSCGSTRAAFLLLCGEFSEAFAMQPLFTLLALAALPAAAAALSFRVRRSAAVVAAKPLFWAAAAALVAANWIYAIGNGN